MPGPKPPAVVLSAAARLADAPKPGAPARLTPEQVCHFDQLVRWTGVLEAAREPSARARARAFAGGMAPADGVAWGTRSTPR